MGRKLTVIATIVVALVAAALLLYRCGPVEQPSVTQAPSVSRAPDAVPRDAARRRTRIRTETLDEANSERAPEQTGGATQPAPGTPPPPDEAPATPPVTPTGAEFSGRVLRSADREPVAGVTVTLRGVTRRGVNPENSAVTDTLGGFRLVDVPPGRFRVTASLADYARRESAWIEVTDDADHSGIELLLTTGGTIEGRVLDRNEAPLAGVAVRVERPNPTLNVAATTTDEDGWYHFEHVAPERYLVEARRGPDQTQSGYVQVADDEVARLDFRTDGALVGAVLDPDGEPLARAIVNAWSSGPPLVHRQTKTDDEGNYRIPGLTPGEWSIQIQVFGEDPFSTSAGKFTAVLGDNDLTIRVEAGQISGKVFVRSTGAPPPPRSIQLSARPLAPGAGPFGGAMAFAKPDGSFRFSGLAAGRYRLRVDTFDASLRALELEVDLASGQHKDGVELGLETCRTGVVRLVVRDAAGKPAEGVTVGVIEGASMLTGPTPSPEPGTYVLRLEVGARTVGLSRPDLEPSTITAEVLEGETTTVEVVMAKYRDR